MPLGKLSRKQIESAFSVLKEIQDVRLAFPEIEVAILDTKVIATRKYFFSQLIDNDGTQTQFLDKSNQFYTLIPHDFGLKKPPLVDTREAVKVYDLPHNKTNY